MARSTRFEHVTATGVRLVGDAFGPASGPAVVLRGGAGQTRQSWGATAARLGDVGYHAVAVDQRGHGDSSWVGDGDYEMARFVEDLVDLAHGFDSPPAVVGASLGGLAALIGTGWRQLRIAALVLVGIAPRIELGGARRVLEFMAAHPDGFDSLDSAVEVIAGYLPERDRRPTKAGLDRVLRPDGDRWRWHWDPNVLGGIGLILEGDDETAAARATEVNSLLLDAVESTSLLSSSAGASATSSPTKAPKNSSPPSPAPSSSMSPALGTWSPVTATTPSPTPSSSSWGGPTPHERVMWRDECQMS